MSEDCEVIGTGFCGRVKFFNDGKGFGFILGEGYDGDIFVHYKFIEPGVEGFKTLKENERVQYTLVKTARGHQAQDVRKLKD